MLLSSYICQLLLSHLTLEMNLIQCVFVDGDGERSGTEGTEVDATYPFIMLSDIKILVTQSYMIQVIIDAGDDFPLLHIAYSREF